MARSLIITQAIFYLLLQKLHTINYPVLQEPLEEPFRKEFTYLSPTSQNEMIDIIGKNIIQATLLDGVKRDGMHSISANEVTSSSDEILSVCIRYLDEFQNIREVFIGFLNLERITGEHTGEAILKYYHELG